MRSSCYRINRHSQRHILWPLNSQSTILWSRLISIAAAVKMVVALKKGHLPSHMENVTSAVKRAIFRKTASQREMVLVVTHPRTPWMSFQNGWLQSLLTQITKIWQQPPWSVMTRITNGATLAMMVRVHGDFTGRMAMSSGKLSKARSHLVVFPILPPMQ